ncbi:tetratricopeptide repeat protein [Morganella morganii]|uniref:tetratricopeptide repeat protein n=1 Tax=Morganella morganii TaxID=582 RepID=UPI001C483C5D|nr:tetratricopeptide repeat protein [Morganella morganii]QXO72613.1 sel1 repeat family protein [Morganella morganii]
MIVAYKLSSRLQSVIFSVFLMMAGNSYASEIVKSETIYSARKPTDIADNRSVVLKANALIQLQIGLLYEEGIGFPQNYVFARYWFEKAAEQNNADALFYLGSYYIHGSGVEKNKEKGLSLYKKASELGSPRAMNNLALQKKQEGKTESAIFLYKKAIDLGSDAAILNLSGLYQKMGEYDKSEVILLSAMDKDDFIKSDALNKLGNLYSRKDFKNYSFKKAEGYYLESIKLGDDVSLNNIGMLYFYNEQYQKSFNYIKMAADKNLPDAINNLGSLYQHGYGVEQDHAKAISLYEKSAEMGSPGGYFNLGSLYEHGDGVKQDDNKAIEYYEKALAAGHYPAQKKIDDLRKKNDK